MPRVRLRQPLLPPLMLVLLSLQLLEPSRAWVILLTAFSGMFLSAFIWILVLRRNLHLRRESRLGWVEVGGQIEERLTLSNSSVLPAPYIELVDHSSLPEFDASHSTGIAAGYFDQWSAAATCSQRGLFRLGDAEVRAGDPFGIFVFNLAAPQRTSILVLPQLVPLPKFSITSSGFIGQGLPRKHAPQKTIYASSVREYLQGDSRRQIHWPTTARMEKMYVRLMDGTPEGDWLIVLDLDEGFMLGTGWDSIEEQGVTLAASLADAGLRDGKSVGLVINGREMSWLYPRKGDAQRWEIMQALALARPGTMPLSGLLEKMGSSLSRHHSLILITASTHVGWLTPLLLAAKKDLIPTILLFDPHSYGGLVPADQISGALANRGIPCQVINRGMLELPGKQPARDPAWKWQTTPSGEIIPVNG